MFKSVVMDGICACNLSKMRIKLCNKSDKIGHFSLKKLQCRVLWTKIIRLSWTTSHDIRSPSHKKWWCRNPALSLHSLKCKVVSSRNILSYIISSSECIRLKAQGLASQTCRLRFWTTWFYKVKTNRTKCNVAWIELSMFSNQRYMIWSLFRKRAEGTSLWSKESISIFSRLSTLSETVWRSMLQRTAAKREVACMVVVQEAKMSCISLWMRQLTMMNMKAKSRQAYVICPRKLCKLWKWKTWLMSKYHPKAHQACLNRKKIDQSLNKKKTLNFDRSKKTLSNC